MNLYQKYFYFGEHVTEKLEEDELLVGWGDALHEYRFHIDEVNEEVLLESQSGDRMAIPFDAMYQAIVALQSVQASLLSSLVGAPNPHAQQMESAVSRAK